MCAVVEIVRIGAPSELCEIRDPIPIRITVCVVQIWIETVRYFPRIRHSVAVGVAAIIAGAKFMFLPGGETVSVGIDIVGEAGTKTHQCTSKRLNDIN